MTKFNVIDSIMGAGKTQYIIQRMNEASQDEKFIYITPYLDEVDRIIESATERNIKQPTNENGEGKKLRGLKTLISGGFDVASTHSLLQTADDELIELLEEQDYTLVIDEAMDVIETVKIDRRDIERLQVNKEIEIQDNGKIEWIGDDDYNTRYSDIYLLAKAGTLYYVRDRMLVKIFSDEVLRAFSNVVVMTYLYDHSQMAAWFKLNGIEPTKNSVKYNADTKRYEIHEYDKYAENREALYSLIDVYNGKLNDRMSKYRLSSRALQNLPKTDGGMDDLDEIEKSIRNFLDQHKEKGYKGYWTSLQDTMDYLAPKGHTRNRISLNLRATNKYADGYAMAYIFDRHPNPMQTSFFTDKGVPFNNDGWAVSDLLQWIYRSRIRNGEDIKLFLPSKRMREILEQWANYEL